jgi:hypothetical protein
MACPRFNISGVEDQAINIGGGAGVFDSKVANVFQFNSLVAGPGVSITGPTAGEITIAGTTGAAATLQTAYDNGNVINQNLLIPVQINSSGNDNDAIVVSGPGSENTLTADSQVFSSVGTRITRINTSVLTIPANGSLAFVLPPIPTSNFLISLRVIATSPLGPETFIVNQSGRVSAGVYTLTSPAQIISSNNITAFPGQLNIAITGGASITATLSPIGPGNPLSPVTWSLEVLYL